MQKGALGMTWIAVKGIAGVALVLVGRAAFRRGHVIGGASVVGAGALLAGSALTDAAFYGLT